MYVKFQLILYFYIILHSFFILHKVKDYDDSKI
jgi:hypothetical protein